MTINSVWAHVLYEKKADYQYQGNLLTLGRQEINIISERVRAKYKKWIPSPAASITPEDYFGCLGFKSCRSLDISNKDRADILHDLNIPVPARLHRQFDFIIDGGTMEHLFNTGVVMTGIAQMLKENGTVIHLNHTQGFCNHGFYNFQPTFYYSFYRANHFTDMECLIIEIVEKEKRARVIPVPNFNNMDFHSPHDCFILFKAVKTHRSTPVRLPNQEFYHRIFKEKQKVNGAMLEDGLYREIVGDIPDNAYPALLKDACWIHL